ncbi:hypothetical protein KCG54_10615 [Neisseria subflava]|jgi:hypothetical protein|uniref:Uncharacterized protein n=1 Tax=Neisseria subflava TaxID=28449 RepID=A0A9X9HU60_NEISU|nr:hypothetical protein [Neisseria subflava]UTG69601.1 hypothetical protein KCG54_10615 [Neisseria subflava]
MAVLLNLFFNEYGLRSGMAWALSTIILFIICAIFMGFYMINHDVEDDFHPTFILGGLFVVYLFLFIGIGLINQYEYIPISGSDIQKANLRRCIVDKTVNLENIEEIMTDCQRRDQELKFKTEIESLGK